MGEQYYPTMARFNIPFGRKTHLTEEEEVALNLGGRIPSSKRKPGGRREPAVVTAGATEGHIPMINLNDSSSSMSTVSPSSTVSPMERRKPDDFNKLFEGFQRKLAKMKERQGSPNTIEKLHTLSRLLG